MYLQATLITFHLQVRPLLVRLRGRILCIYLQRSVIVKFQHVTVKGVFFENPEKVDYINAPQINAK